METRKYRLLVIVALALGSSPVVHAEHRQYIIGTSLNLTGSGGSSTNGNTYINYAGYPSVQLTSKGKHTDFNVSYAFGYDRDRAQLGRDSQSHSATARFNAALAPKWNLSFSEAFDKTADRTTFNAVRGVVPDQESFRYLYSPLASQTTTDTKSSSVDLDYLSSEKSTLSMSGSFSRLSYSGGSLISLSGQDRISGRMTYDRRVDEHSTLNLSYAVSHYAFPSSTSSRSHSVSLGYSHQLTRTVAFQLSGGPAYVKGATAAASYTAYNTALSIQKTMKPTTVSLRYSHDSGVSTGVASVSNMDQAGLSMSRLFGKRGTFGADLSVFRSGGRENFQTLRGATAVTTFGLALNKTFSITWGAQYQRQEQPLQLGFEDRRLFVSFGINRPDFWSVSR